MLACNILMYHCITASRIKQASSLRKKGVPAFWSLLLHRGDGTEADKGTERSRGGTSWSQLHSREFVLSCSHSHTPIPVPQNEVQNVQMQLGVAGSESFRIFVFLSFSSCVIATLLLQLYSCSNGYTSSLQVQRNLCWPCCKLSLSL